jgi:hypothetical protein
MDAFKCFAPMFLNIFIHQHGVKFIHGIQFYDLGWKIFSLTVVKKFFRFCKRVQAVEYFCWRHNTLLRRPQTYDLSLPEFPMLSQLAVRLARVRPNSEHNICAPLRSLRLHAECGPTDLILIYSCCLPATAMFQSLSTSGVTTPSSTHSAARPPYRIQGKQAIWVSHTLHWVSFNMVA